MRFLRRGNRKYSKLGLRRKKKQVWRKPTGRHNKMREGKKGYPAIVSIGYSSDKKTQKNTVIVNNLKELEKIGKEKRIIIGNIGKKKKMEIAKKAKEMKIEIYNMNPKSFLKKNEKPKKEVKEEKK